MLVQKACCKKCCSGLLVQFPVILIVGLLISLLTSIWFPYFAKRLYFILGAITAIVWLYERGKPAKAIWFLLLALSVFSLYRIGHTMAVVQSIELKVMFQSWLGRDYVRSAQRILLGGLFIGYFFTKRLDFTWLASTYLMVLRLLIFMSLALTLFSLIYLGGNRDHFFWDLTAISATCLVVTFYTIFLSEWLKLKQYAWFNLLDLSALSVCVLLVIWFSGTRSALLSMFLVSGSLYLTSSVPYKKITVLILSLLMIAMVGLYGTQMKEQLRIDEVVKDLTSYEKNLEQTSSIGARFEVWRAVSPIVMQSPIVGVGSKRRIELIKQFVENGQIGRAGIVSHMHNDFLEELTVRGSVGLLLLCSFYIAIIRLAFYNRARYGVSTPLLALVGTYVLFGMTDVVFIWQELCLVFMLLLILILVKEQKRFVAEEISI